MTNAELSERILNAAIAFRSAARNSTETYHAQQIMEWAMQIRPEAPSDSCAAMPCELCKSDAEVCCTENRSWVYCRDEACHCCGPNELTLPDAVKSWNFIQSAIREKRERESATQAVTPMTKLSELLRWMQVRYRSLGHHKGVTGKQDEYDRGRVDALYDAILAATNSPIVNHWDIAIKQIEERERADTVNIAST